MKPGGSQAIEPYGTDEERGESLIPIKRMSMYRNRAKFNPLAGPAPDS